MNLDCFQDATFSVIRSVFPLKPIEDDGSYRAAIEILDRLFAVDDPRTPAELEYFQILASFACEYEMRTCKLESSAPQRGSSTRCAST